MEIQAELMTVEEVARFIRRTRFAVYKAWPSWARQGVTPIRVGGGSRGGLLFRRRDIENMVRRWQQVESVRSDERENATGHSGVYLPGSAR